MTKTNTNSNGLLVNRAGKVRIGVIEDMLGTLRVYHSQSLIEKPDVTARTGKRNGQTSNVGS